jgi:SAM-dependent methyltransferase
MLARNAATFDDRAIEIALFLGLPLDEVRRRLACGFGHLHNEVTHDLNRRFPRVPRTDAEILEWYRTTEAYIWELTAYHEDIGFNYAGMCKGIGEGLVAHGCRNVLCLGDGIGDLTLTLCRQFNLFAWYHDLEGSRTAEYAQFRFWRQTGRDCGEGILSKDFSPPRIGPENFLSATVRPYEGFDAVASLDFLEHVPNVEEWVRAVHGYLRPGGMFVAQNAFAIGSGDAGAMPMHLSVNDRFEKDWDPLLKEVGFEQLSSNWYRRL